jgi:hypothetical protein
MRRTFPIGPCLVLATSSTLFGGEAPAAPAAPSGRVSTSPNFDLTFGGRMKADASYDDSNAYPGEYVLFVNPEGGTNPDDNDEFNITARETRLWINATGPRTDWIETSGRVEIDFFGNAGAPNKSNLLLRHAFMDLNFPKVGVSFLAGQTWDVISPLVLHTLNYSVGWDQGNIGYRRPQLRLTKKQAVGDLEFIAAASINRTIDADSFTTVGNENGEDSGIPTVEGRLGVTFPFIQKLKGTLGVSAHHGVEEITRSADGRKGEFQTWSFNVDVALPFTKYFALTGEFFTGRHMDTFFGGIGQGVDLTLFREIDDEGGWVQGKIRPHDDWEINIGYGVDDPDNSDLSAGKRSKNDVVFANVRYALLKDLTLGIEYSHLTTDYKGQQDADDNRVQFSTILTF